MANPLKKYKWDTDGKTHNDNCPDFDFIEGCKTGLVVWWDEREFCIDRRKLPSSTQANPTDLSPNRNFTSNLQAVRN